MGYLSFCVSCKLTFLLGNRGKMLYVNANKAVAAGTVFLSSLLAGCGGGWFEEFSRTPPAVKPSIQGLHEGKISTGDDLTMLVLEKNQFYSFYGTTVNNVFAVKGFFQGNATLNNGSFSSTDLRDFTRDGTVYLGSLSATYTPGVSFNGSVSEGSSTATFTSAPVKSQLYNYDTAATLSNITGAWNLTDLHGTPVSLNVASSGAFTGSSNGCSFSGTIKTHASGKNIFDMTLTFGTGPCRLSGKTLNGVGIDYAVTNGKKQLVLAGTDNERGSGTTLTGAR